MKSDNSTSAVSLFSFQDIITSLTGIVFLMVLMLLVILFETPDDPGTGGSDDANIRSQHQKLEELQLQKQQLSQQLEQLLSEQPAVLKRNELITQYNETLNKLRENQEQIYQSTALKNKLAEQQRELTLQITQKNDEVTLLADQAQQLQDQVRDTMLTVTDQKVLQFTITGESGKRPLLAECSATQILVWDPSYQRSYKFADRKEFLAWADTRDKSREYFSLLFKPDYFGNDILLDELKALGFARGLEILPSNEVTIFELPPSSGGAL